MAFVITPGMLLLIQLMIDNAAKLAFNTVPKMTPEELAVKTKEQEEIKAQLIAEIKAH